jgi:hypothetical protein
MKTKLFFACLVALLTLGCGSNDSVTETKVAPSGEIEGREPSFKMVPSQKDPSYSGGK